MEVVTDNLANSATPGYRCIRTANKTFDDILGGATRTQGQKPAVSRTQIDLRPGPIRVTGRPLDFSIMGSGFFVVTKDGRELHTRNGQFQTDADGSLTTAEGLPVMGTAGRITIPIATDMSSLTVDADGTIRVGRDVIANLRIDDFADSTQLQKIGQTLILAPQNEEASAATNARVSNRTLEGSNTSVFEEMAEMISCMRAYESCQKILQMLDQTEGQTIKQLG